MLNIKTTAHFGSSGVASSIVAKSEIESEVTIWAEKQTDKGYKVTVQQSKTGFVGNAQLTGEKAAELKAAYNISKVN